MKKLFALVVAAAMTLSLVACGAKEETPAASSAPAVSAPAASEEDNGLGDYPNQTISWIVPVNAGTPTDLASRQIADLIDLDANIAVENVTGGNQTIGINEALSRAADGYTIMSLANAGLITQPLMNPDIGYGLEDLKLLAMITPACMATITVNNDSSIKTYEDWVEFVTTHDEFTFAVPNSGGYGHLSILSVLSQLGVTGGKAIAYDGNNGAYQAMLSGEVDFAISDDNVIYTYHNDGTCNTIVCLANESSYYLPDVPAISDYGIEKMDSLAGWKIIGVSADTPDAIVDYLKEKIDEVLSSDVYAQYLLDNGCGAFSSIQSSEEITALVEEAFVLYGEILTDAGLM